MNPININEYPWNADHRTITAYKIAVMQAYADGQSIQLCNRSDGDWSDAYGPVDFNWTKYAYRIKVAYRHFRHYDGLFCPGDYWVRLSSGNVVDFMHADGHVEACNHITPAEVLKFAGDGSWVEFDGKPEPVLKLMKANADTRAAEAWLGDHLLPGFSRQTDILSTFLAGVEHGRANP